MSLANRSPDFHEKMLRILDELSQGSSLKHAAQLVGIPLSSVQKTLLQDPSYHQIHAQALQQKADFFADEIVEIADNEADPMIARNRIDARRWVASKLKPIVYGDRVDLNVNQTVSVGMALSEAKARTLQVIDVPRLTSKIATDCKSVVEPEEGSFEDLLK